LGDQTANALMYIKKKLGNDYSFSDIEGMLVRDVMDMIMGDGIKKDRKEKEHEDNKNKVNAEKRWRTLELLK